MSVSSSSQQLFVSSTRYFDVQSIPSGASKFNNNRNCSLDISSTEAISLITTDPRNVCVHNISRVNGFIEISLFPG